MRTTVKRRLMSVTLILFMLLSLLPVSAYAENIVTNIPGLGIGSTSGSEVKADIYYLIDSETGAVSTEQASAENYNYYYSSDTSTLTLKDAKLKSALYVPGGTTIELIGDNTFGTETSTVSTGIQITSATTDTALTVKGNGSLTIWSLNEGIGDTKGENLEEGEGNIVVEGGKITITNTQSAPIYSRYGGIEIKDATVLAKSGNSPISCEKDMTIGGSAQVTVQGDAVIGLQSSGKITISDRACVNVNASNIAITGFRGIDILGTAEVTAVAPNGALSSFGGSIKIEGTADATATKSGSAAVSAGQDNTSTGSVMVRGNLTASGDVGIGVNGTGDIIIDGGKINVDTTLLGIYPTYGGNVEIKNDAEVTVNTTQYGIYAPAGKTIISNSTVTSTAGNNSYFFQPTLTYTSDRYTVHAGTSAEDAQLVSHSDLADKTFQSKYVKIQPAEIYAVTVENGSADVAEAAAGETVTIEAEIPTGQKFAGWTSSCDVTFADKDSAQTTFTMPEQAVTITANFWTPYTVTFDVNGGSCDTESASTNQDGKLSALPDASRSGYFFDGWYTEKTGGAEVTTSTVFDKASTVYAHWSLIPTYPPNVEQSDNVSVSTDPANPKKDDTVTVTVIPKDGYKVSDLAITDEDGNKLPVTDNGDGTYSFVQPKGTVTIQTSLIQIICDGGANCLSKPYQDVNQNSWYHEYVDFVIKNGYMIGVSNDPMLFDTEEYLTRAQAIQTLYNMEGKPKYTKAAGYSDVKADKWYMDAISWATENRIVAGRDDGSFAPNEKVTRQDLVTIMYRYVERYKGLSVATDAGIPQNFTDSALVSGYANSAVAWAIDRGIISGMTDTTLEPRTSTRRCEMAKIIAVLCDAYSDIP